MRAWAIRFRLFTALVELLKRNMNINDQNTQWLQYERFFVTTLEGPRTLNGSGCRYIRAEWYVHAGMGP